MIQKLTEVRSCWETLKLKVRPPQIKHQLPRELTAMVVSCTVLMIFPVALAERGSKGTEREKNNLHTHRKKMDNSIARVRVRTGFKSTWLVTMIING